MKQNSIEINENLFQTAKELYNKDVGNGKLLPSVLDSVMKIDKDAYDRLVKLINKEDFNLFKKNDLIQKIILNKVILIHVLKLRARVDDNLTVFMSLLSYKTDTNEWKKVVTQHILPTLIKNDYF